MSEFVAPKILKGVKNNGFCPFSGKECNENCVLLVELDGNYFCNLTAIGGNLNYIEDSLREISHSMKVHAELSEEVTERLTKIKMRSKSKTDKEMLVCGGLKDPHWSDYIKIELLNHKAVEIIPISGTLYVLVKESEDCFNE